MIFSKQYLYKKEDKLTYLTSYLQVHKIYISTMGYDSSSTKDNQEIVLKSPRDSVSPERISSASSKSMRRSSSGDFIVLESPDLILNSESRCNLSSFRTYLECSGPWKFLISNRRRVLITTESKSCKCYLNTLL